ncbi:MAG: hypothetical protein JNM93_13240 [Bacteriovoracaceae bacterium]|nr:hypothetical protein [Bacteriovoracaceae bacterium]
MKVFLAFFILIMNVSLASEIHYLLRSPRGLLMGDAYTTVAKDSFAIFYNPASLARAHGFTMTPLNPQIQMPNILSDTDKFSNLPDDPVAVSNEFLGYPIHLASSVAPGFRMGPFAFSAYVNSNTNIMLTNAVQPTMDLDYRLDRGFMTAYAFPIGSNRVTAAGGTQLSMGLTLRYNKRKEIKDSYPLFGTTLLDILETSPDSLSDLMDQFSPAEGRAWGFDLGFEYIMKGGGSELIFGLSFMDALGTKYTSVDPNNLVAKQEMQTNMGVSFKQSLGVGHLILSADIHPVMEQVDMTRKLHFGAALDFGLIEALAGYNAGYMSYGFGLDLYVFELYAGLYEIEVGVDAGQKKSKRALVYLNLAEFHFDF